MSTSESNVIIVYDDREFTNTEIQPFVGNRRYSEIIFRRRKLREYFSQYTAGMDPLLVHHLQNKRDISKLRFCIENAEGCGSLLIISSRAGIPEPEVFKQLLARLPYAEDNFTDRIFKPLIAFFKNSNALLDQWELFDSTPILQWDQSWEAFERLTSVLPLDLGRSRDFLLFMSGSTESRHFNQVEMDNYYYTKSSSDKKKMEAEYRFYSLVPEKMRPWLIQPFGFEETADSASYKMTRYYLADAALQWVHGAFSIDSFTDFIDRLLFFIAERPAKKANKATTTNAAHSLFIEKVETRIAQLLKMDAGIKINKLVELADPELELNRQCARFRKLYDRYGKELQLDFLVAGHGDPCFSNVLYDQQRYLLKVIDPKGALKEEDIWAHPYYDLCKISHSILGNYDYINNGLYEVCLDEENKTYLKITADTHQNMKQIFLTKLKDCGYNWRTIRLGEASLFLSMLPLHIDHPNKIMAFVLTAKQILDELENG